MCYTSWRKGKNALWGWRHHQPIRGLYEGVPGAGKAAVVSIMMALFDQEKAVEQFGYEREQKGREEGDLKRVMKTAANMLKGGEPIDKIARILEFPPETILSWVGKP